jgi:FkbM family methyltransferase
MPYNSKPFLVLVATVVARLRFPIVLRIVRRLHNTMKPGKFRSRLAEVFDPNFLGRFVNMGQRKKLTIVSGFWGERLLVNLDDHLGYRIFLKSYFDIAPASLGLLLATSSGDTKHCDDVFLDVGANIGSSSIALGLRGIPVVAIEPSSKTLAQLCQNVSLNSPLPFTVLNVAVTSREEAERDKFLSLYTVQGNLGATSLMPGWAGRATASTEIARLSTIDDIARLVSHTKIFCIKIDVEGYEINVLAGARETLRKFTPFVLFEWRPDLMTSPESADATRIVNYFPEGYSFSSVTVAVVDHNLIDVTLAIFDPRASVENVLAVPPGFDPKSPVGNLMERGVLRFSKEDFRQVVEGDRPTAKN